MARGCRRIAPPPDPAAAGPAGTPIAAGGAAGLVLTGITLIRRGKCLLDGLRLDVELGEIVAVMGPSGAGKTTLLRTIAGLAAPQGGQIDRRPERVAMVFQDPRLLPWRTALQNVELVCDADAADHAQTWLQRVGLANESDLYPAQLSGGMRQRVAVARALAHDARLVLVDEPFANLDAATARALQDELATHLVAQQRTVLWVTHNADEAAAVAQRTLTMAGPPTGAWHLVDNTLNPIGGST